MEIKFVFPHRIIDIHVDLIDNPVVESWKHHYLSQGYKTKANKSSPFSVWPHNGLLIQEFLDILNDFVDSLREAGYGFPYTMPKFPMDITRSWCNDLYRFCDDIPDDVSAKSICLDIKLYVAKIERYLEKERDPADIIEINVATISTREDAPLLCPDWKKYFDSQTADVILSDPKFSKNLFQRYLDADEPKNLSLDDLFHTGGLCLQVGREFRQNIYQRDDFQKWLGNTEPCFNLPIGNISNKSVIPDILKEFSLFERDQSSPLVDTEILL